MLDPMKYKQLKDKYKDEQVFVVPTSEVTSIPDKFCYNKNKKENVTILHRYDQKGKFIYRYDAEGNSAFQQLIPYILIYNPDTKKYFVSKRTKKSGEERLYEKISLGFGGHLNPCDGGNNILWNGLIRELNEEVEIKDNKQVIYFKGTIRNIASELNDHLGFVFIVEATDVIIKEKDKLIGQWMSVQELIDQYINLEDWAKFIIDYIYTSQSEL